MRSNNIVELREMMKGHTDLEEQCISDQMEGVPCPPIFKHEHIDKKIMLPKDFEGIFKETNYLNLINNRMSRRVYKEEALTLNQLAFLLWSTQGVKKIGNNRMNTRRTVPSAGARHALETYLFVNNVEGLEKGIYHYESETHALEYKGNEEGLTDYLSSALCGQLFAANAPVCFVWTAIPYRTEWRYNNKAQKYILLDVGHVCQNLYLSCEAMGLGTCAIAAYNQAELDGLLQLDTEPSDDVEAEFAIYVASVGVPK